MFSTKDGIIFLESSDLVLAPIYLFFLLFIAVGIRNSTLKESPLSKYFMPGLIVKILGGLAVGVIYGFYYQTGDSFYYWRDASAFNKALGDGIGQFFNLITLPANTATIYTTQYTYGLCYFRDPEGWMAD